jgi:GPH family glycoside/pentoside/hexuronide:cation symporter
MVIAILASALGTHHEIARLPKTVVRSQTLGAHFRELWETVKNRGFLILMLAGICAYTNQGISYALSNYTYSYVWQFKSWTLQLLPFALMLGAALAFVIAPAVGKRTSKPHAAMAFVLAATVFHTMPYWLRFAGVLPPPGSSALVFLLLPIFVTATALSVSSFILGASMMADVVEDSEARTGRRSEGVYFAGSFFVQKCTSGLGIMIVGQLLDLVSFPKGAKPGMVPVAVIDHLTLAFILIYGSLAIIAAFLFTKFPFGRTEHEARLERMIAAAEAEGVPHTP